MQGDRGLHPLDYELLQRTLQPHQAALARGAVDDQLGDHAVVIGRHPVAGVKPAIDADVHPARRVELRDGARRRREGARSEEHTSELQSLMRISYAVFCLKKKKTKS